MPKFEFETIEKSRIIAKAAPRAAPDATPNVKGETNGFPRLPCIKDPAMAKVAPPTIAIKILGKRSSQMIADSNSPADSIPNKIFKVVKKSKFCDEPKPIATTETINVKILRSKTQLICF